MAIDKNNTDVSMKRKSSIMQSLFINIIIILLIFNIIIAIFLLRSEYSELKKDAKFIFAARIEQQKMQIKNEVGLIVQKIKWKNSQLENELKTVMKDRVNQAFNMIEHLYNQYKNKLSTNELQNLIRESLRNYSFDNGKGYFFAASLDGTDILYPLKPEIEGQNILALQDGQGNFVVQQEIKLIKDSTEGFSVGYWAHPNYDNKMVYKKISYIKYFEQFNWYIGTGAYVEDNTNFLKQTVKEELAAFRFGDEGYVFIIDTAGVPQVFNQKTWNIDTSFRNITDKYGTKVVEECITAVKTKNSAFIDYHWKLLSSDSISLKTTYIELFKEWQWIIGAGFYHSNEKKFLDNKEAELKQNFVWHVSYIAFGLLVSMGLIILATRFVLRKAQKNIQLFENFFEKAAGESVKIQLNKINFFEFEKVAQLANNMIDERQHAQNLLKISLEKINTILLHSPDIIMTLSKTGEIIFLNKDNGGFSKSELINKNWQYNMPPATKIKHANILAQLFEKQEIITFEFQDFSESWFEARLVPIKENDNEIAIYILSDITVRKWSEESQKQNEVRFRKLSEASFEGILIYKDNIILEANNAALNYLGYQREELIGQSLNNIVEEKYQIAIAEKIRTGDKKPIEIILITKDNRQLYTDWRFDIILYNGEKVFTAGFLDNTDRILAQNELLKTQILFRAAIEQSPLGIIVVELPEEQIKVFNSSAVKIFGVHSNKIPVEMNLRKFKMPWIAYKANQTLYQRTDLPLNRAIREEFVNNEELYIVRSDKKVRWILSNAAPIYDSNQQLIAAIHIIHDISARKIIEKNLKESKQNLAKAQKLAKIGSWKLNLTTWKIEWSAEVYTIFDKQKHEFDGKLETMYNFIYSDDLLKFREIINKTATSNEVIEIEHRIINSSGKINFVNEKAEAIFDVSGKPEAIIATIQDITERKLYENALRESNEKYKLIFETNPLGVFHFNTEGFITNGNKNFASIVGVKQEFLNAIKIYNLFGNNLLIEAFNKSLQKEIGIFEGEYHSLIKKEQLFVKAIFSPIIDSDNKLIGGLGIIEDISTRKQTEENLKLAKQKAEESDKLKSAFLANMSHEIRTPMNAIIGFSELMLHPELSQKQISEYINYIISSGNTLLTLIDDIIDIAKMEAGQLKIQKYEFSLHKVLYELFATFKTEKERKVATNIDFQLVTPQNINDIILVSDATRFKQIFTNLLSNALKFTEKGEINFGYCVENDQFLKFWVRDTGIGISEENKEIIFGRFMQVFNSSTRKYGGTGLGLTISKNIVELLGGKMWVESIENNGTTFLFTIPFVEGEIIEKQPAPKQQNIDLQGKTILIAEDELVNFILFKEALIDMNINLIHAVNGFEAVEICKNNPSIALVLMDIKMPVLNGYEAAKQILKFRPNLPIIAQSAFAMVIEIDKSMEAGCCAHISKPININYLKNIISKYII